MQFFSLTTPPLASASLAILPRSGSPLKSYSVSVYGKRDVQSPDFTSRLPSWAGAPSTLVHVYKMGREERRNHTHPTEGRSPSRTGAQQTCVSLSFSGSCL